MLYLAEAERERQMSVDEDIKPEVKLEDENEEGGVVFDDTSEFVRNVSNVSVLTRQKNELKEREKSLLNQIKEEAGDEGLYRDGN